MNSQDFLNIKNLLKGNAGDALKGLDLIEQSNECAEFVDALINSLAHPVWKIRKRSAHILSNIKVNILNKLIDAMDSSNEDRSFWAIKILGNYKEKAIEPLSEAYKKKGDLDKRFYIISALGSCRSDRVVPCLIQALSDPSWSIRKEASDQLVKIGSKSIPALHKAVKSNNSNLKYWAIKTMAKILGKEAIEPMQKVLEDKDSKMRYYAVLALGEIEHKKACMLLIKALGDSSWIVRKLAADQLHKAGEKIIPMLVDAFEKGTPDVKYWAIQLIGKILKGKAVEPLKKIISDPDENLRSYAVLALGETRSGKALPYLIKMFSDQSWLVREQAAEVILKYGKKGVPFLNEAINSDVEDIRFWAIRVLAKLSDAGFDVLEKNIAWMDSKTRLFTLDNLIEYNLEGTRKLLIHSLGDSHWPVRKKAYTGLLKYGPSILKDLIFYINSSDQDLRYWISLVMEHYSKELADYLKNVFNSGKIEKADQVLKYFRELTLENLVVNICRDPDSYNDHGHYYAVKLLSRAHGNAFNKLNHLLFNSGPKVQIMIIKSFGLHTLLQATDNLLKIKSSKPEVNDAITVSLIKKDSLRYINHLMNRFLKGSQNEQKLIASEFSKTLPEIFITNIQKLSEIENNPVLKEYTIQILSAFIESDAAKYSGEFKNLDLKAIELTAEAAIRCSIKEQAQFFEYALFNWPENKALKILLLLNNTEFPWFPETAFNLIDIKDKEFRDSIFKILNGYSDLSFVMNALEKKENLSEAVLEWCKSKNIQLNLEKESQILPVSTIKSRVSSIKKNNLISESEFYINFKEIFKDQEKIEDILKMKDFLLFRNISKVLKIKISLINEWAEKFERQTLVKVFLEFVNSGIEVHGNELVEAFRSWLLKKSKLN